MKIRALLLALLTTISVFAADPAPDAGPAPTAAETAAVAALAKLGVDARPIAAGLNWRTVLVRLGKDKPDPKIFAALKDVTNLQELDLAGVQLADADLAQLAGLKNLRVLHLEKTPLTDAGLAHSARAAAQRLGLAYEEHFTGYGDLATSLATVAAAREHPVSWEKTAWRR
jgi:Leucine-rich repeat (LRR) protein